MTAALKTKESSVAEEFEIPEHLGQAVEELKKEQQTLKSELEVAKSQQVVRKQDESTRVFNLRQHQMELKIQELEDKKVQTEKELQNILQQKNSKLHDDLKKLAQFILQESKKISTIANLRNELQQVFDSNLSDRKKNMGLIEEQNIYIHQLGELVRDTSKLLQNDFHFITGDIGKLQTEKQDETRKLAELKVEIAHHQGLFSEITARKKELQEIELKIQEGQRNALTHARMEDELSVMRTELHKLHEEKERLHASTVRLHQEEFHGQESLSRLKLREKHLEHVISGKKDQLQSLEADILDVRKRLEMTKNDEAEIHRKYLHHRDQLVALQNELARMEGARTSYTTMLEDSQKIFEEKRSFFQRELEYLERFSAARNSELESQLEMKKARWEEEFRLYTENKKSELSRELDRLDKHDLEDIRKKKNELLTDISRIMGTVLSEEGFSSTEERTKKARKEVEKAFHQVFGKTQRWKIW